MKPFDNPIVFLKRPISVTSIAEGLAVRAFELMGALIPLEIFVSPTEELSDDEVLRVGEKIGVDFRIDEGGES